MNQYHKNKYQKIAPLASAVFLALYGTSIFSQELQLEEVIVTAQKRSQSLQDIPATVNVISGDTLKDFNTLKFEDLEALTAGLQIDTLTGRSGQITLRGISFSPASAAEAAVTNYWNESIVDSNAVFQQLFDIDRIEVLRGPQGTLAGRTSPAGAINIHTAKPNLEKTEGYIRGVFADNDGLNTQVAASFPLIPGKLAMRVAAVRDESNLDEIENILTGEISGDESNGGRVSLSWLPNESLSVDLAVQYLEREIDDIGVLAGAPSSDPRINPRGIIPVLNSFDRRDVRVGVNGVSDNTQAEYLNSSLVLNWELDSHTITSVTGYHETDSVREFDQAQGNANPGLVQRIIAIDDRKDFSQEVRIASTGDRKWDYMVGAYFEDSDIVFSQENFQIPLSPIAGSSTLLAFPAQVERRGLFTHNEFYLSDDWTLQLGLRYQEVEVDRDMAMLAGSNGFVVRTPRGNRNLPSGTVLTQVLSEANQRFEDDAFTGQISLQYDLSDTTKVYGLVGTGWRPGGVTVTGSVLPEDVLLFESEDSVSYELGFKSTLKGGAIRLNGAVYYQDLDDYISRVVALNILGTNGALTRSGITGNGDAEALGAELEMNANLSENWFLGGTLSYSDSEFADGTVQPCNLFNGMGRPIFAPGQSTSLCDVGGEPIGRVADVSASINSEYRMDFGGFEGYGRALYSYTGEQFTDLGALDSYNTFDVFLGVRTEKWDVELFVRNLFDEEALIVGSAGTPPVLRQQTGFGNRFLIPSRRVGLSASYRW